jgi:ureidoacrylate peracid hydrolase
MQPEVLMTLEEKLNPAWTALICIDYQNDFCAEGGALDRCGFDVKAMAAIAPALGKLIDGVRAGGVPVLFVRSTYATKENWYLSGVALSQTRRALRGLYHEVPLCEPGTWGWEYFGGVRPRTGDLEIFKHRQDAFADTDLDLVLRARRVCTLILCGVATNVCVESAARHAYFKDYYGVVPSDCVAAYGEDFHAMSLQNIDRHFGEVATSDRILVALGAARR